MDALMDWYNHNNFQEYNFSELYDLYTISLNGLYKQSITEVSMMGFPKDPDFEGEEIKPKDIYYNLS